MEKEILKLIKEIKKSLSKNGNEILVMFNDLEKDIKNKNKHEQLETKQKKHIKLLEALSVLNELKKGI
jgi:hypothetical protein